MLVNFRIVLICLKWNDLTPSNEMMLMTHTYFLMWFHCISPWKRCPYIFTGEFFVYISGVWLIESMDISTICGGLMLFNFYNFYYFFVLWCVHMHAWYYHGHVRQLAGICFLPPPVGHADQSSSGHQPWLQVILPAESTHWPCI